MCLMDLFWGMWGGQWAVEMACTCLGGFSMGGSNSGEQGGHRKKSFFRNNSLGLSMYDGLIETVKYILVKFDACLTGFCHKTAEIHFLCIQFINQQVVQKLRRCLHCLNSFQRNNYVEFLLMYVLLRENHKVNAVSFPSFHNGCNPTWKV